MGVSGALQPRRQSFSRILGANLCRQHQGEAKRDLNGLTAAPLVDKMLEELKRTRDRFLKIGGKTAREVLRCPVQRWE